MRDSPSAADRRNRRAPDAVAVREVARALAAAEGVHELLQGVADRAIEITQAFGAYIERVESRETGVEVVAVAGYGTPPVGTRVPYPGSLTEEITERGEPELLIETGALGERLAPYLAASCHGCSGLVVPLPFGAGGLGALVLLRSPGQRPFGAAEAAGAGTLGDLAALVLPRITLLDALRESERRLRAVLEAIPIGVFITNRDGSIAMVNRAVREIWGEAAPMSTKIGQYGEYKAWWPGTGRRVTSHEWGTARALEKGEVSMDEELEIETFGGERKTILHYALPIPGEEGGIAGAVAVNVDITARKRAQTERERLLGREQKARAEAERRERAEEALGRAAAAVNASFDIDEVVRRIAEGALEATGAHSSIVAWIDAERGEVELVAGAGEPLIRSGIRVPYEESVTKQVVERAAPQVTPDLAADVAAGRAIPREMVEACGHCSAVVVPLRDAGESLGSLILLRQPEKGSFRPDEIARAATFGNLATLAFRKIHLLEESEQRREELERALESRSGLMRGFTHDVKNPLGAADSHLGLLEEGIVDGLSEKQKESVGRIRASIHAALELIGDLVALARAEAGELEIESAPADVREVARVMAEEYRAQAEAKEIELRADLPAEIPITQSDPARVRQILGNLISNAVKYTDRGEVTVRVEVRSGGKAPGPGRWIAVDVSDTGAGIPADRQHLLFREFARPGAGTERGAGIGLAISRRVARALGGEITFESEERVGSTFTLWLPLRELSQAEQRNRGAAD